MSRIRFGEGPPLDSPSKTSVKELSRSPDSTLAFPSSTPRAARAATGKSPGVDGSGDERREGEGQRPRSPGEDSAPSSSASSQPGKKARPPSAGARMPLDVLIHVFSRLSAAELSRVQATCQLWRDAGSDPSLWRSRCISELGQAAVSAEEDRLDDEEDERARRAGLRGAGPLPGDWSRSAGATPVRTTLASGVPLPPPPPPPPRHMLQSYEKANSSLASLLSSRPAARFGGPWKSLLLDSPHVRTDGIYVSRNTYVKPGAPGLIGSDATRPAHVVCYFRYLAFAPPVDLAAGPGRSSVVGLVAYRTTPHPPSRAAQELRLVVAQALRAGRGWKASSESEDGKDAGRPLRDGRSASSASATAEGALGAQPTDGSPGRFPTPQLASAYTTYASVHPPLPHNAAPPRRRAEDRASGVGALLGRYRVSGRRLWTAVPLEDRFGTELRGRFDLLSTKRGAHDVLSPTALVAYDARDGAAMTVPFVRDAADALPDADLQGRSFKRGLAEYEFVAWADIPKTHLNRPAEQVPELVVGKRGNGKR